MKRLLIIGCFSILVFSLSNSEDNQPIRLLVHGGGEWHPYGQCTGAFFDAVRKDNTFVCSYTEDPQALQYEHLKRFNVLMLYNGVYYLGDEGKQKEPTPDYIPSSITQFVKTGGGLVVIHSAMASFSDWRDYIDLIGGIWVWGTSAHDAYGTLSSRVVARQHPILENIPDTFEFQDEFYHTLRMKDSVTVLIDSTHEKNGQTVTEPLAWITKDNEQERSVTILHGHDMGSWGHPTFQRILKQAVEWAARKR